MVEERHKRLISAITIEHCAKYAIRRVLHSYPHLMRLAHVSTNVLGDYNLGADQMTIPNSQAFSSLGG